MNTVHLQRQDYQSNDFASSPILEHPGTWLLVFNNNNKQQICFATKPVKYSDPTCMCSCLCSNLWLLARLPNCYLWETSMYIYKDAWKLKDTNIIENIISKFYLTMGSSHFRTGNSCHGHWGGICFHVTNVLSAEKSVPSRYTHNLVNVKDECKRLGDSLHCLY